jgi:hypothetical protein
MVFNRFNNPRLEAARGSNRPGPGEPSRRVPVRCNLDVEFSPAGWAPAPSRDFRPILFFGWARPRVKLSPAEPGVGRVRMSPATPGGRHSAACMRMTGIQIPGAIRLRIAGVLAGQFVCRHPRRIRERPLWASRFGVREPRPVYSLEVVGTPAFRACSCKSSSFCLASSTDFCLSAICCLYCASWVSQSLESLRRLPASE